MRPVRDRYALRQVEPGLTEGQYEYARRRESRAGQPYTRKIEECGRYASAVQCGCGKRVIAHGCRGHLLCGTCKRERHKRQGNRIRHSSLALTARMPAGIMPVLLTMTAEHSSSVGDTWERIADGWAAFRDRWQSVFGRFYFVGVWEMTAGRDGLGHPHLHVIAFLPYVDGKLFHRWWTQSCPSSSHMHVRALSGDVKRAVGYLAKYLSKGIETREFSPELRARVLAGTYGKRWVTSSRGRWNYWAPFEPQCPGCHLHVEVVARSWEALCSRYAPKLATAPPDDVPDGAGSGVEVGDWECTRLARFVG